MSIRIDVSLKSPRWAPGRRLGVLALGLLAATCKDEEPGTMMPPASGPALKIQSVTTRSLVAEQMRAAIEMQQSGEPLAETMGRDLAGYTRSALVPDQYEDPASKKVVTDVAGYSAAVESYEYSKLAMNMLSFESGAGLSLMYGPLVNPAQQSGATALGLLRTRVQALAVASHAHAGVADEGPWVIVPAPAANPLNPLGFPGLWPQFAELRSFDPAIAPSGNATRGCTLEGGYGAMAAMKITVSDYECGYNTLHISRDGADKVLDLDALGYAAWKQALWVINYFQLVHDVEGNQLTLVAAANLAQVGKPGNAVVATDSDGKNPGKAGTYLGSSDLEGFQGLLMAEEIDNKAALLLGKLTTTDGAALGGFATTKAALDYDWQSGLRFFPHAVGVTETAGTGGAEVQPTAFAIQSGESRLADLSGLLGAYSAVFALTDAGNADLGGSSTMRPLFDGDPFPADNGMADGEATPHDRALAVLKVALVNLGRLHLDGTQNVLFDRALAQGGGEKKVSTVESMHAIVALRTAYRALTSQLTLYSNSTPDRSATTTALDGRPIGGIPGGGTLAAYLQRLIKGQADFLSQKLVGADGLAVNGFDLTTGQADPSAVTVDAQAAAIRGLLEAYLSTSNAEYRARAQAAYAALEQRFFHKELRVYRPTPTEDTTFKFSPLRFALIQSALREMYTLVGSRPGQETLAQELEARLGRLNKLVLNGWDDANSDGKVDYPGECMRVEATLPRGGLQLAERALTGELGVNAGSPTSDRDKDCVPEIDDAKLPAALAAELVLVRK